MNPTVEAALEAAKLKYNLNEIYYMNLVEFFYEANEVTDEEILEFLEEACYL